jgi:hypothetical protein
MGKPYDTSGKTAIRTALSQGVIAYHNTIRAVNTMFRGPPNGIILRLMKRIHPLARQAFKGAEMRKGEIPYL